MFNSQNIYHRLVGREYALSALGPGHLMKNISQGNSLKTLFNAHRDRIIALDVQGYFAVTAGDDKRLNLWNLKERRLQWSHERNLSSISALKYGILKITGDSVVLASTQLEGIEILDLETGCRTVSIPDRDKKMNFKKICVIGQSIFIGVLNKGQNGVVIGDYKISELTFQGKKVRKFYHTIPSSFFSFFIGSSDFIIDNYEQQLVIYDLQTTTSKKLKLPDAFIQDGHIDKKHLICTTSSNSQNNPHFCVINLETGQTIHQLRLINDSLKSNISRLSTVNVRQIVSHKECVYLGYSNGVVVACNLAKRNYSILGQHSKEIDYLALEGHLLVSGSSAGGDKLAEVKFWDIRSCKQIGEMRHPSRLSQIRFVDHKLLATIQGSLIQWDYLVSHRGEKMTEGSPTEITKTAEECVIQ